MSCVCVSVGKGRSSEGQPDNQKSNVVRQMARAVLIDFGINCYYLEMGSIYQHGRTGSLYFFKERGKYNIHTGC